MPKSRITNKQITNKQIIKRAQLNNYWKDMTQYTLVDLGIGGFVVSGGISIFIGGGLFIIGSFIGIGKEVYAKI